MSHLKQEIAYKMNKVTPWSFRRERNVRIAVEVSGWLAWIMVACAVAFSLPPAPRYAVAIVCAFFALLVFLMWRRAKAMLGRAPNLATGDAGAGMLANKPCGDVRRMTQWIWHRYDVDEFACPCGMRQSFLDVDFHPNEVDPGGGRYALVCGCGRGHYKMRAPIAQSAHR